MKIVVALCAVIVIVGLSIYFSNASENIKNYPPHGGPVVAFGDSLVKGIGADPSKDFVSLLSAKVGEPIINLGMSGDTTEDGLARIDTVLEKNPRIVILLLGGNDYLRKVPQTTTFDNLRDIVTRLQGKGAVVLILGIRGGILQDHYAEDFEALAKDAQTPLVPDVLDGIITEPSLMSDAIHPNNAGYEKIADEVYPTLSKLLH